VIELNLMIINKDDFKIYVSCCKNELEQLKNKSVNINDIENIKLHEQIFNI
jgi:hypothetical protein